MSSPLRKYKNSEPVSDMVKVLLLLAGNFGDKTQRKLEVRTSEPPFVRVEHYGGHYDEIFDTDYYSVTAEVVQELRRQGFVAGTPHWGYTDENEMKITERGRDRLRPRAAPTPK